MLPAEEADGETRAVAKPDQGSGVPGAGAPRLKGPEIAGKPAPGLPAGTSAAPTKHSSPTSVMSGPQEAQDLGEGSPEGAESSAGSSGEAPEAAPTAEASSGEQSTGEATVNTPPSDESLAQLRVLGRQLLLGWAEALGTLAKLPGVGSMRVESLAARLQQLALEASPVGAAAAAAAAAAVDGGEAAAAASGAPEAAAAGAAPDGAASGPGSVASRGGTPPPAATELAGPACHQRQAYSDPVDMFATAAKSAHLSYPELLHAFAASAEGEPSRPPVCGGRARRRPACLRCVWLDAARGRVATEAASRAGRSASASAGPCWRRREPPGAPAAAAAAVAAACLSTSVCWS